ncbi:MAG: hypothetical protein QW153_00150 [Candidatus Bilamarchaeaceae archaeon]
MKLAFLLLLLVAVTFADDCVGYSENLHIRVLDSLIRPVEGASVSVTFDRGTSFGEKYFTTQPKKTDENGSVYFTLLNQGTETRKIDCNIYIDASFGPTSAKKTITALKHPQIIDVKLPIYRVIFYVRDQNGKPLENATVFFNNETKKTNKNGNVIMYSENGTQQYLVTYRSGSESGFILVSGDTTREAIIPIYEVKIDVYDDRGEPLSALVSYSNETLKTEEGKVVFKVYNDVVEIKVQYDNIQKNLIVNAKEKPKESIYFDLNAPLINEPKHNLSNNRVRMSFEINDLGQYASGVDPLSIRINYRLLPDGQWQKAKTYSLGSNLYGIDFPELEKGTIVEFNVEASDYEGNKAYKSGRFVIETTIEKPQNESGNKHEKEEKNEEYPIFYAVFGLIFIIFVVYLLKKFIEKQKNG